MKPYSFYVYIADAIASSAYRALNVDDYGYREDKYISVLTRNMYARNGKTLGYGIKYGRYLT